MGYGGSTMTTIVGDGGAVLIDSQTLEADKEWLARILVGKTYCLLIEPAAAVEDLCQAWRVRLSNGFNDSLGVTYAKCAPAYATALQRWCADLPAWSRHSIAGRVCQEIGDRTRQWSAYSEALRLSRRSDAVSLNAIRCGATAFASEQVRDLEVARRRFQRAGRHATDPALKLAAAIGVTTTAMRLDLLAAEDKSDHRDRWRQLRTTLLRERRRSKRPSEGRLRYAVGVEIAHALVVEGRLSRRLGRIASARTAFTRAYSKAVSLGHTWLQGLALLEIARIQGEDGDYWNAVVAATLSSSLFGLLQAHEDVRHARALLETCVANGIASDVSRTHRGRRCLVRRHHEVEYSVNESAAIVGLSAGTWTLKQLDGKKTVSIHIDTNLLGDIVDRMRSAGAFFPRTAALPHASQGELLRPCRSQGTQRN